MQKLFHFDSPADQYVADAAVLCCFDHRIQQVVRKFVKRIGVLKPDWIIVAGGAKTLASPVNDAEQQFILQQIRASIGLHQARRVILTCHSDCGAYGGLAAHAGNRRAEAEHHLRELKRAAEVARIQVPGAEIESYFIDFEGVWQAQTSPLGENPAAD